MWLGFRSLHLPDIISSNRQKSVTTLVKQELQSEPAAGTGNETALGASTSHHHIAHESCRTVHEDTPEVLVVKEKKKKKKHHNHSSASLEVCEPPVSASAPEPQYSDLAICSTSANVKREPPSRDDGQPAHKHRAEKKHKRSRCDSLGHETRGSVSIGTDDIKQQPMESAAELNEVAASKSDKKKKHKRSRDLADSVTIKMEPLDESGLGSDRVLNASELGTGDVTASTHKHKKKKKRHCDE